MKDRGAFYPPSGTGPSKLAPRHAAGVRPAAAGEPAPPSRILLVEDQPSTREVLAACLAQDCHGVETVASGLAALEALRTGTFDLVVTDQGLPDIPGDRLARVVKEVSPRTSVLLLPSFGELEASDEPPPGVDIVIGK
ncbi:MAG: response regulator, partial [Planctomycetota bacterium]